MAKVSVIIPTYNRGGIICAAIDSVLNQSYHDYEIIVIDDGSSDDTRQQLQKYGRKIQYIYQENKGVSATRNAGLQQAKGTYIAFLDSDDTWNPDKLEKQIKCFENNPSIGLLYSYGAYRTVNTGTVQIKPRVITRNVQDMIEKDCVLPTSTVMINRECLDKVGFFDETLLGIEDFDLWFRIAEEYPLYFQDEVMAQHNYYGNNLADQSDKMSLGYIKIYNKIIAKYKDQYNVNYMKKRLSQQHYSLGIYKLKEKNISESFAEVNKAISAYPLVGIRFTQKDDRLLRRVTLGIKPYLVWLYLLMTKTLGKKIMGKDKINILYVHGNSNIISGQEKVLVNIARGVQKDGHFPTVILPEPGQFADLLKKWGVPVHFLKLARLTRRNPLPYIATVIGLFFYIKKNNIQIVHTSGLFPNQYSSVAAKLAGIPCICHVHSTIYTKREVKNSFLQLASLTIAVSQSIRDRFIQEGADPGKIIVIYNGLGLKDYQLDHKKAIDLKKELGLDDGHKVITQISQIIERKGILYFIKMAKHLLERRKDVVFLLVGDDKFEPGYMQEMKTLAVKHGIQEAIKFTGYRSEIPELIFISDVIVLNSFLEGLPLVLMQAMIMNRPVVATKIPGVDELIENGISGILVAPGNYRAMAEQVNSLLDSPAKVKAMTTAGRIKVTELMDLDKQISQIENVYRVYLRQEKTIAGCSENGLVSVIIPTFNCGKFIAEGLNTIFNQTYKNIEVIIVDDGSTDDTRQVLRPFLEKYSGQIKYVYQTNSKCAAARNTGIALAKGEYIAFHDADDLCQIDRLEKSLEFLRKNNFDWICTGLKKINMNRELLDERLLTKRVYGYNENTGELYDLKKGLFYFSQGLPVHANTLFIKRDCLKKVGLLDESFFICEETDLCIRFQDNGLRGGYLNEMLVTYRSHLASITKSNILDNLEFVRKLGEKVARKSGLNKQEIRNDYANLLWELSAIYYQSGKWGRTLGLALKSLYFSPKPEKIGKICKYLVKSLKRVMHGKNKYSLL